MNKNLFVVTVAFLFGFISFLLSLIAIYTNAVPLAITEYVLGVILFGLGLWLLRVYFREVIASLDTSGNKEES